jgi:hyperosmotically inducible periplasmic protein
MKTRTFVTIVVSTLFVVLSACATNGRTVGERVDDATIVSRANLALAGSPTASAWDISVESRNGTVLLSGFVDSNEERREAERLVAQVDGVAQVRNNIELNPVRNRN